MEGNEQAPPLESLRLPPLRWRGTLVLVGIPLLMIVGGLYAYIQQRLHGDVVTSMRSVGSGGAAWGLYIMFDIFFVGLAATGIAVTSAAHLFRMEHLRPISRIAEFMAVVALALAGICVMADQGRPLEALLNLPNYARVMSPFFGSFTLIVGVGLAASAVMLYLGGRGDAAWCARRPGILRLGYVLWASGYKGTDHELGRHRLARFWLSLTMFPFIIAAYSTLGFVFGTQGGRPGWFGALRAPSMLIVAGISGIGLLMALAGILKLTLGARDSIPDRLFSALGKTLVVLISVFFYILVVETLTERYAGREAEMRVSNAILLGAYAPVFWSMLAAFVVALGMLLLQFLRRKPMVPAMIFVGLLLNVAAVLRRFLVVVPAQTHGHYLDYEPGIYVPNAIEFSVIAGVLGIGILAFVVFMRTFPIIPLHAYYGRMRSRLDPEPNRHSLLRLTLTTLTLVVGLSLTAFGLAMSARVGTEAFLDPVVAYSPVLFIIGIVMTIYSAAVYVIVPPG